MTTLILVSIPVLLVLVGIGCLAFGQRRAERTSFRHFRCPGCKQRLRYQARKAGRSMICPQCYRHSKLPMAG
jgi:hypothetical protein